MIIAGVILSGGAATRMGGANKGLLKLVGKPLVQHVAERLKLQVHLLGVNSNRDQDHFTLPIVSDGIGGGLGPLDGILGAMLFAEQNRCSHALTVAVDTPFIPQDLVEKLSEKSVDQIKIASSNGRLHGTCGLWPVAYAAGLRAFILSGKSLKVMDYLKGSGFAAIPFEGDDRDPFFNINTPHDLAAAARWL